MEKIKEQDLIKVKTITRKIFEQIPQRAPKTRADLPLPGLIKGFVNNHAILYQENSGHLFWIHWNAYAQLVVGSGEEKWESVYKHQTMWPQIFLS
jgi:hypothetical protein